MKRIKIKGLVALSLSSLLLAGCTTPVEDPDAIEEAAPEEVVAVVEEVVEVVEPTGPRVTSDGGIIVSLADGGSEELTRVFYFDYDQAIVKRSGHLELDRHAKALMDESSISVRLEGHADERGTREYNLALGERRANAVRAYLVAQGVSSSQIEVTSYGEEKPAVLGANESSWAQNRRVRFSYR